VADGGEGTLAVLLSAAGGTVETACVRGPLGGAVNARWGRFPDGLAVIEAAEAIGLELVPKQQRDPTSTSSFGVGELILAALESGVRSVTVAVGGTATMDLGTGMAQALGVEFAGGADRMTGAALLGVRSVGLGGLDPRLKSVALRVAVDVKNPLLGAQGAARTYGPQKGGTPEQIEALERGFRHLSALIGDDGRQPGDGAAGGIAYLMRTLFGAEVVSGATLVMDATGFEQRLEGADLVVTGEGRFDAQTAQGKVVHAVAHAAHAKGIPVVAISGSFSGDGHVLHDQGVVACFSICNGPMDERAALSNAATLLAQAAENVARLRYR